VLAVVNGKIKTVLSTCAGRLVMIALIWKTGVLNHQSMLLLDLINSPKSSLKLPIKLKTTSLWHVLLTMVKNTPSFQAMSV